MTKVIESITVEIQCEATDVGPIFGTPFTRCHAKDLATIIATDRGDLVLVPVGWDTAVINSRLTIRCPDHKEEA
jgi:hypothetical protein